MRQNPPVPAAVVMKHIQASKNRIARCGKDMNSFREGLRALQMDAIALRTALDPNAAPSPEAAQKVAEDLALLESNLMALQYAAGNIVAASDQYVRMELAFQASSHRFLHGRPPGVTAVQHEPPRKNGALPTANGQGEVHYERAQAMEVRTPARRVQGSESPTRIDAARAVGFYTQEDGTRVFVNARNEPVPAPKIPHAIPEMRAPDLRGAEVPSGDVVPIDEAKAVGFYTLADGTRVFVNGNNTPVPVPKEWEDVPIEPLTAETPGYTALDQSVTPDTHEMAVEAGVPSAEASPPAAAESLPAAPQLEQSEPDGNGPEAA